MRGVERKKEGDGDVERGEGGGRGPLRVVGRGGRRKEVIQGGENGEVLRGERGRRKGEGDF